MSYPRISSFKTAEAFRQRIAELDINLPFDDEVKTGEAAPLAKPIERSRRRIGNRFCILPMEGWDGTEEGQPSDLTRRRWENFGLSGAKFIWGGEAVARPSRRAGQSESARHQRREPCHRCRICGNCLSGRTRSTSVHRRICWSACS